MTLTLPSPGVTPANWGAQLNDYILAHGRLVTQYGATGDGSTDDTDAVQDGLDALSSAGGGTLIFPKGTYMVNSLTPKSHVNMVGTSWASIIKQNADAGWPIRGNAADALVENVIIANLKFDCQKSIYDEGSAIAILRGKNISVYNCWTDNTPHAGIFLGNPNATEGGVFRVIGNYCDNPGKAGNGWGHIAFVGGSDIVCIGNTTHCTSGDGQVGYGLDIEGFASPQNNSRVVFANNMLKVGSIRGESTTGAVNGSIIVTGNFVNAVGTLGNGPGMAIANNTTGGSTIVSNNMVIAPSVSSPGINVHSVTADGGIGAIIANNFITGMGSSQNTSPDNVGIIFNGAGIVAFNYIHAASATHATAAAGIQSSILGELANQHYFGNRFHSNITVRGVFQSGDIIATADLPAAHADRNGLQLIEDAGAGDRNLVFYAGGQRFRIDGGAAF